VVGARVEIEVEVLAMRGDFFFKKKKSPREKKKKYWARHVGLLVIIL